MATRRTSGVPPGGTLGYSRRICHYCNKRGHIRPRCFQFFIDLRRANQQRFPPRRPERQEWVKKSENKCNVAFISLKASTKQSWYFDSRCSRHMTGERSFLEDVQPCDRTHHVTFRDGTSSNVLGKGNLCVSSLPKLTNVWLVSYAIRISL